jgi:hypothetical protein
MKTYIILWTIKIPYLKFYVCVCSAKKKKIEKEIMVELRMAD